jgi:precorrin-6A/cobalt-precorrin-6A reductase
MPTGRVRFGGFGGSEGLIRFIREEEIEIVADAAHPFAVQISTHGFEAARQCGIGYVRLERPPWRAGEGDDWTLVGSSVEAAAAISRGAHVLLTIGRRGLSEFMTRDDLAGVMRMIEPPDTMPPSRWSLVLARPPFTVEQERLLMREHGISVLVTKNAGGAQMATKLQAARDLGISVVMIERPKKPEALVVPTAGELVKVIEA